MVAYRAIHPVFGSTEPGIRLPFLVLMLVTLIGIFWWHGEDQPTHGMVLRTHRIEYAAIVFHTRFALAQG